MKNGKGALSVIITIVIMLVIFSALVFAAIKIGFLKVDMNVFNLKKEDKKENIEDKNVDIYSKEYNVDDYVTVSKDEESGLKLVSFKNLDFDDITKFKDEQGKFKDETLDSGNRKSNTVRTNIDKAILSVYSKDTVKKLENVVKDTSYAININVETKKSVTNSELIELYEKKSDTLAKAILNKLVELSTDIVYTENGTEITANDIKTNSTKYTSSIKDNIEKFTVYTRKDKVYCDFSIKELVDSLGIQTKTPSSVNTIEINSISI